MKVLYTWSPLIASLETLPHDWTTNLEVLVGKAAEAPCLTGDTRQCTEPRTPYENRACVRAFSLGPAARASALLCYVELALSVATWRIHLSKKIAFLYHDM